MSFTLPEYDPYKPKIARITYLKDLDLKWSAYQNKKITVILIWKKVCLGFVSATSDHTMHLHFLAIQEHKIPSKFSKNKRDSKTSGLQDATENIAYVILPRQTTKVISSYPKMSSSYSLLMQHDVVTKNAQCPSEFKR